MNKSTNQLQSVKASLELHAYILFDVEHCVFERVHFSLFRELVPVIPFDPLFSDLEQICCEDEISKE